MTHTSYQSRGKIATAIGRGKKADGFSLFAFLSLKKKENKKKVKTKRENPKELKKRIKTFQKKNGSCKAQN